jgi:hypothetical protein
MHRSVTGAAGLTSAGVRVRSLGGLLVIKALNCCFPWICASFASVADGCVLNVYSGVRLPSRHGPAPDGTQTRPDLMIPTGSFPTLVVSASVIPNLFPGVLVLPWRAFDHCTEWFETEDGQGGPRHLPHDGQDITGPVMLLSGSVALFCRRVSWWR